MNTINAAVGEGRELVVDSVKGYSGEHNAEMIAVRRGQETSCRRR